MVAAKFVDRGVIFVRSSNPRRRAQAISWTPNRDAQTAISHYGAPSNLHAHTSATIQTEIKTAEAQASDAG